MKTIQDVLQALLATAEDGSGADVVEHLGQLAEHFGVQLPYDGTSRDVFLSILEGRCHVVGCTVHHVEERTELSRFCITPDDEDAKWSADVTVRWDGMDIIVSLEHSGPIAERVFTNDEQGLIECANWVSEEVAE